MSADWNEIKLIVSDFDGVMTDNRVLINEDGKESVYVNRSDGLAMHILRSLEIDLVIITTEPKGVAGIRAEKLNVECIQNVSNKAECLKKYCEDRSISMQNIAYIGNDINDYDAMLLAGFKIVPQDAYEEVKNIADYITNAKGGYGVIREVAGIIKKKKEN